MNVQRASTCCALLLSLAALAQAGEPKTIYGGPGDIGHWIKNGDKAAVPAKNAQTDGLNPHDSGAYVVLYDTPVQNFVLDLDYKLSKGCNSGVFIRVGKPEDPVMTGLEVAIDDTTGHGMHDSGALYDLVPTSVNAQKPVGEWNHMKITAKGPIVEIVLNGQKVATLDHDQFSKPTKRPDGSDHKFTGVAIKDLNQKGYLGFQDHGSDCWYKNVKLEILD